MTNPEQLSGAFSSCADDTTDAERDAMVRLLLITMMTREDARVVVEYPQGNFNIGSGHYKNLTLADVQNQDKPLPQEALSVLSWDSKGLHLITVDLSYRNGKSGIVSLQEHGGSQTLKMPVSIALEYLFANIKPTSQPKEQEITHDKPSI